VLSQFAPKGTEYHEAWHRVSNLLITPERRERIFKRARKRYVNPESVADQKIDEDLAEQYKWYVLHHEQALKDLQAANWFKKIYEFVKIWKGVGSFKIAKLYYDINVGKFCNVKPSKENIARFKELYAGKGPNFQIRGTELKAIPTRSQYDNILNGIVYATI
jgi:hypothetical protein